jgi:hypothetical protein
MIHFGRQVVPHRCLLIYGGSKKGMWNFKNPGYPTRDPGQTFKIDDFTFNFYTVPGSWNDDPSIQIIFPNGAAYTF